MNRNGDSSLLWALARYTLYTKLWAAEMSFLFRGRRVCGMSFSGYSWRRYSYLLSGLSVGGFS